MAARPGTPTPTGRLLLIGGTEARGRVMLVSLDKPLEVSPFMRQDLRCYRSMPNHGDLVVLQGLVEPGKLRPVIYWAYPPHETPADLGYPESKHARGKVVIMQ